jgi:soluble lytic murein transglycosylase
VLTAISLDEQSLRQHHERILRHLQAEEFVQAEKALVELEQTSPQTFARNSFDYLLGRVRQRLGKNEAARRAYLKVVQRNALVSEYAYWHLAELARSSHKLQLERQYLEKILAGYPESLLADRARWRLAESYFESKEYQPAIGVYTDLVQGRSARAREAQLKIGQAEFRQGKLLQARTTLETLLGAKSRDDTVLEATGLLDEIDGRTGVALTVSDHLQRARIYQANRAVDQARRHYQWIVDRFPASEYVPEALFEIGRGYYLQDDYDQAIVWYERVHDRFPKSDEGEQGYYQAGHAQARAGRWSQAVERYESFITAYPQSEFLSGAYLNAIDALRSAGMNAEALTWCQRTIQRFPGKLAAPTALFSQARIHLAQNNYQAALADFDELLKQNLNRPGSRAPNRPEVTFMRGYCLEKVGRYSEAIDVYLSLPQERDGYYGYRADARLRALTQIPKAKELVRARFASFRQQAQSAPSDGQFMRANEAATQALRLTTDESEKARLLDQMKDIYSRLPEYQPWRQLQVQEMGRGFLTAQSASRQRAHRTLAGELIFLGLDDEGAPELAAALKSNPHQPTQSQLYTLAVLLNRGGYPDEAIRMGETYFAPRLPKDYRLELLPRELAQMLYPTPYVKALNQHDPPQTLDPRFVLAVMHQESRFQTDAKSPAAARGLMQFIPATAKRLAVMAGKAEFDIDDLYNPETSIQLGVLHLQELQQKFPNNLYAVAAAFNAGADNAQRWMERARSSDPDRFVIEIGFQETKQYVYRVMANYWAYQQIVSEPLHRDS